MEFSPGQIESILVQLVLGLFVVNVFTCIYYFVRGGRGVMGFLLVCFPHVYSFVPLVAARWALTWMLPTLADQDPNRLNLSYSDVAFDLAFVVVGSVAGNMSRKRQHLPIAMTALQFAMIFLIVMALSLPMSQD